MDLARRNRLMSLKLESEGGQLEQLEEWLDREDKPKKKPTQKEYNEHCAGAIVEINDILKDFAGRLELLEDDVDNLMKKPKHWWNFGRKD